MAYYGKTFPPYVKVSSVETWKRFYGQEVVFSLKIFIAEILRNFFCKVVVTNEGQSLGLPSTRQQRNKLSSDRRRRACKIVNAKKKRLWFESHSYVSGIVNYQIINI